MEKISPDEHIHTEKSCLSHHALTTQAELRASLTLCDACINLDDGGQVYVHRVILCASCEYFRALFTSPLGIGTAFDINISEVSTETMQEIVDYVYSRTIDLTEETVVDIIEWAHYFGLDTLVDVCASYVLRILQPENCISYMLNAKWYLFDHDLQTQTRMYVLRNFNEIAIRSDELLELPFDLFFDIIDDEMLNVKDEEPVWICCLSWINHDLENRKKKLPNLLEGIRLGLLAFNFFITNVRNHEYLRNCEQSRPILDATLKFMSELDSIDTLSHEILTPRFAIPRLPYEVVFAIGGWYDGNARSIIESYDSRADRWIIIKDKFCSGPRAYHGSVSIGSKIYCIGGYNGFEHYNICTVFDVITREWKEISPMHQKRCYVAVCKLNDKIYAIGGHNGTQRLKSCERYCPETNQWTLLKSMSVERSDASACVLNGKIYAVGGFNGVRCLDSVECYDELTGKWSLIREMTSRRSGLNCITFRDHIYAIGGFNGTIRLDSGERYDPITTNWFPIKPMNTSRSNFGIEIVDDMIFVFGGFDGITTTDQTECYNVDKDRWYDATSMNNVRSALSATVVGGIPNIKDYIYKNRQNLLEERRAYNQILYGRIL